MLLTLCLHELLIQSLAGQQPIDFANECLPGTFIWLLWKPHFCLSYPTLSEDVKQMEGLQKSSAAFLVATVTPPLKPPPKVYHIWAQTWFMEDISTPLTYRAFKLPASVQTYDFSYLFFQLYLRGLEDSPGSCFDQDKSALLLF